MPRRTFEVIALGTVNVLEACRLFPVWAVVTASSNHVYGLQMTRPPWDEKARLNHLDAYPVSKICADYMARAYAAVYRVPTAILRNTNCFGPDDPHMDHIVPSAIMALMDGKPVVLRSDGMVRKAYLYVEDVAEAYVMTARWLAERWEHGEAFNVSGTPVTAVEIVERIAGIMGVKAKITTGEYDPLQYDEFLNDRKIRKVVGWKPRHTLDEGLRKTIDGFRARYGK